MTKAGWIPYRLVHCGLVIVSPCPACRGEGWIGEAECERCETTCEHVSEATWLVLLLDNLAIAGALCRAFSLGVDFEHHEERWYKGQNDLFSPGCGRSAP
jgi:hypothetical protein